MDAVMFALIESSVYETIPHVSLSQSDCPSLFWDNQSAGRTSADHNSRPFHAVDTLFKHNGATSVGLLLIASARRFYEVT